MTERFSIEAIRERAHLSQARRECHGLPPADSDIQHLLAEVRKWKPIETAPKDGTEVDLWCKQWKPGGKFIHKRFTNYRWVTSPPHWTAYPQEHSNTLNAWEPTHWMSPPDPPEPPEATASRVGLPRVGL